MAQHKEEYFIIPMLRVLYAHNAPTSTEEIKKEIKYYCDLSDEDLTPYPSRSQKEPRYFQIVGNIISHSNPNFFKYVSKIIQSENDSKKANPDLFLLNDEGKELIKGIIVSEEDEIDGSFATEDFTSSEEVQDPDIEEANQRLIDMYNKNGELKRTPTDKYLSRTVLELTGFRCQVAVLLGEEHLLFNNKNGEPYLEIHHLIPLKASKDFFPLNLDIAPNLVPLCPNCHAKLHRGSYDEKLIILRMLYDKRIKALNENGVYISFEDLLNKYYI